VSLAVARKSPWRPIVTWSIGQLIRTKRTSGSRWGRYLPSLCSTSLLKLRQRFGSQPWSANPGIACSMYCSGGSLWRSTRRSRRKEGRYAGGR